MSFEFLYRGPHFIGEADICDVYNVEIKRGENAFCVKYGLAVDPCMPNPAERKIPTAYDILAVLQNDEPAEDVRDFAFDYEYEINNKEDLSRVARIHEILVQEYRDVSRVFGDVLEQLREFR